MEQGFIRINIAFRPSVEAAGEAERLSLEISRKEEAYFVLDGSNFHPHITIYASEFPAGNIEKIGLRLEELSEKFSSPTFNFSRIQTDHGYIGAGTACSRELRAIHEAVVNGISPLREGHLREKYVEEIGAGMPEDKKNNILRYGHPDVMELYQPHLTITRLKDEKIAEEVARNLRWEIREFDLDTIGVYQSGDCGTCVALMREFRLG